MPVRHTIEQVQEFREYIDSITKIDANSRNTYIAVSQRMTRRRADEIRRFVENEQAMCCLDSDYFDTRYCFICNDKGDIFQFSNRASQKVFDGIIAQFDEQQVAIELMILKARQQGISTKVALKFLHRLLYIPHTQGVMASVQAAMIAGSPCRRCTISGMPIPAVITGKAAKALPMTIVKAAMPSV